MSDELRGTTQYLGIDIPARFVRQAIDHIEHTGARYVTFLFTGDQVQDATCIGVTTAVTHMITQPSTSIGRATKAKAIDAIESDVVDVTQDNVLGVIRAKAPISIRHICDAMGISGTADQVRQKVRRIVLDLVADHVLWRRTSKGQHPKFALRKNAGQMPIRPPRSRSIARTDITENVVMAEFMKGRRTTRTIGDTLEIPRHDALVRQKITEIIRRMQLNGRLRDTGERQNGGRIYELTNEATATSA